MRNIVFVLSLLFAQTCFAELHLSIGGPTEGYTGDMIVVNHTGSVGKSIKWIIPKELEGKTLIGIEQLGFATRFPGTYTIYLYGTDGDALGHTSHTVTVKPFTPVPPVPVEPPPVDTPPVGNFDALKSLSQETSALLNDPVTRKKLAEGLSGMAVASTLLDSQIAVEKIVTDVMASRSRDEQDADWFNEWYVPVLKKINELGQAGKVTNVAQYEAAMKAVTSGLKE